MVLLGAEALKGDRPTRDKLRERIDFYLKMRRKVLHPVEGMAAKRFSQAEIAGALAVIDKNIGFYQDTLEGF